MKPPIVHNHGPAEGAGLDCPEHVCDGRFLRGACVPCIEQPHQRPTTRQISLMRLAEEAETLADKADALLTELTEADASLDIRARLSLACALLYRIMDQTMAMAREDES